ncbi:hypothetical protein Bbelb_020630 [Branchiostoma belcheri]|nr:hypothetical protein Bbelb_020630 [Branchiostoma belcheri]
MSKAVTHSPWRLLYPSSCRSTNQHEPHDTPWGLCSLSVAWPSSSYEHRCQLTGPRCVKVPTAARVKSISKEETPGHSVGPLQRCTVKEGHLGTSCNGQPCSPTRRTIALPGGSWMRRKEPGVFALKNHVQEFKVSTKREEGASEDMRGLNRSTSKRLNRSKILKWSTSKRLRRNT